MLLKKVSADTNHEGTITPLYMPGDVLGRPFQELLASAAIFSEQQLLQTVRATEAKPMLGRYCSGQSFPIELSATETTAKAQRFFTVFIKDVSVRRLAEDALLDSRAQKRAKAAALEHAMAQLRRTQAQLIQQERMPGKDQLVAGIAHEINNPTSFIYGNLNHAKEYVEELLFTLEQYRQHYYQHGETLSAEARLQLATSLEDIDIDYIATDLPKLISSMQTGTQRIRNIVEQLCNFRFLR